MNEARSHRMRTSKAKVKSVLRQVCLQEQNLTVGVDKDRGGYSNVMEPRVAVHHKAVYRPLQESFVLLVKDAKQLQISLRSKEVESGIVDLAWQIRNNAIVR